MLFFCLSLVVLDNDRNKERSLSFLDILHHYTSIWTRSTQMQGCAACGRNNNNQMVRVSLSLHEVVVVVVAKYQGDTLQEPSRVNLPGSDHLIPCRLNDWANGGPERKKTGFGCRKQTCNVCRWEIFKKKNGAKSAVIWIALFPEKENSRGSAWAKWAK